MTQTLWWPSTLEIDVACQRPLVDRSAHKGVRSVMPTLNLAPLRHGSRNRGAESKKTKQGDLT